MRQRDAVFMAVSNVVKVESGVQVVLDKEMRARVVSVLVAGFESGEVELKSGQSDLKGYANGLLSNWLRKDSRLNGGGKYVAKAPGSRTGNSDPMIKALRLLLADDTNPKSDEEKAEIEAHIAKRLAEIKPTQAKSTQVIDFSALPAELAAKYSTSA